VQRKVFRIEQMIGGSSDLNAAEPDDHEPSEVQQKNESVSTLEQELAAIRSAIDRTMRELSVLINDGNNRRMTRAAGELGAAVEGMETATQKILASAEAIDDCARALASALSDDYHHGLTQDVQDQVVRIYEACNFQDLAGQRIGKVIATMIMVEERLAAMIARYSDASERPRDARRPGEGLINGPRLDGADGHATQCDIDAMFA
jgi:chemotaxis protein CheZ